MSYTSIFLETTLIVIFHLHGINSRVFSSFLWFCSVSFLPFLSNSPFKKFIGYILPFLFIFTKEKTIQLLQLETAEIYRHELVQAVSPGRFVWQVSVFFSLFRFIEFLKVIRCVHCKSVDISSLHCTKIKSIFFYHLRFDSNLAG